LPLWQRWLRLRIFLTAEQEAYTYFSSEAGIKARLGLDASLRGEISVSLLLRGEENAQAKPSLPERQPPFSSPRSRRLTLISPRRLASRPGLRRRTSPENTSHRCQRGNHLNDHFSSCEKDLFGFQQLQVSRGTKPNKSFSQLEKWSFRWLPLWQRWLRLRIFLTAEHLNDHFSSCEKDLFGFQQLQVSRGTKQRTSTRY
jgi:hypothetical protein